ncbi:MAG: hypothetical protein CVU59_06770, partial [Deltaproteobacteria bacterium HGW-Deltaproteobacteria-17]
CFIATSVYGDRDHPFVRILRSFRDVALMSHAPGRRFVRWYYRNGPTWAGWIDDSPVAAVTLQILMLPLVIGAAMLLTFPIWLLLAFWMVRRRRVARRSEVAHA